MTIKFQLPNPEDVSAEEWFSQMRITLKAAEKMYQETVKGLTDEEKKKDAWITFELSDSIIAEVDNNVSGDYLNERFSNHLFITVGKLGAD